MRIKIFLRFGFLAAVALVFVLAACQNPTLSTVTGPGSELSIQKKGSKPAGTIQGGTVVYSVGHYLESEPLEVGFDAWGYNYQAHMFRGSYVNVYLGGAGFPPYEGDDDAYLAENPGAASHWAWPYRDIQLVMKWNDAWISNIDHDSDGALDRHWGFTSYVGSSAWLTNHQSGWDDKDGHWTYFTKIVAVPADAKKVEGVWYSADDTEIGPVIWGSFATIQDVESGLGATYVSPSGPGFGKF